MKYKSIIFFSLLFLIIQNTGCSVETPKGKGYSENTSWYKTVNKKNINSTLTQYKYKMQFIDTSDTPDPVMKQLFINFGNNLQKYGVVVELSPLSLTDRRIYLTNIVENLGGDYDYSDTPFLLFYYNEGNKIIPKKILSFSNLNKKCIKEGLERVEYNIHKNSPEKDFLSSFEKYRLSSCSAYENNSKEIKTIFLDLLKTVLSRK